MHAEDATIAIELVRTASRYDQVLIRLKPRLIGAMGCCNIPGDLAS